MKSLLSSLVHAVVIKNAQDINEAFLNKFFNLLNSAIIIII